MACFTTGWPGLVHKSISHLQRSRSTSVPDTNNLVGLAAGSTTSAHDASSTAADLGLAPEPQPRTYYSAPIPATQIPSPCHHLPLASPPNSCHSLPILPVSSQFLQLNYCPLETLKASRGSPCLASKPVPTSFHGGKSNKSHGLRSQTASPLPLVRSIQPGKEE